MKTSPIEDHSSAFPYLLGVLAVWAPLLLLISGLNTFPGRFLDRPNSMFSSFAPCPSGPVLCLDCIFMSFLVPAVCGEPIEALLL